MDRTVTILGIKAEVPDDELFSRYSIALWQVRVNDSGPWYTVLNKIPSAIRTFAAIAASSWRSQCGRREECVCQCTCAACVKALPWQRIFEKSMEVP